MRPTVATALSLAAVLCAGTLAAAANLRVFAGPDNALDSASAAAGPAAEPGGARDGTEAQLFQVGQAGTVTLGIDGGVHVVRADPLPGWRATPRPGAAGTVVVDFTSRHGGALTATGVAAAGGLRLEVAGTPGDAPVHSYDDAGPGADDD